MQNRSAADLPQVKCFSWTAVFIGGIVGLGLSFLLNIFAISIGLSAFTSAPDGTSFAFGGFIGFVLGTIAVMFLTGWVAGFLGRPYCKNIKLGALYGFVAWCLVLIMGILLVAPLSRYVVVSASSITHRAISANHYMHSMMSPKVPAPSQDMVEVEQAANDAGKIAFVFFVLTFIGAVSSCFGGCYGMYCKDRYCASE